jgi:hypothetical protein
MMPSLLERFRQFGHRAFIDYDNPGGGDPEICRRCNALISTAYSRSKSP